jgi:hypothetical protein
MELSHYYVTFITLQNWKCFRLVTNAPQDKYCSQHVQTLAWSEFTCEEHTRMRGQVLSEIVLFQIVFSFTKYMLYTEIYISGKLHTFNQQ